MTAIRHIDLGHLAGISIQLHLSWLLLIPLGAGTLALEPLAVAHADWSPPTRWLTAVATTLLMALSVVLHDVGHLATAVWRRLPIRRVILYPFGGVTQMGSVPMPVASFIQMTVAGPLASLLLAGAWLAAWWTWGVIVFLWLAAFNLALALLNLLPAPPLDGGRLLWLLRGRLPRGTGAVSFAGTAAVALGITLPGGTAVLSGVILASPSYVLGGTLLLLVGWLVQNIDRETGVVCTAEQHRWLHRTPVARLLALPTPPQPAPASPTGARPAPAPGTLYADTGHPRPPLRAFTAPTLQPWVIYPHTTLLQALHKMDAAGAARLLVVAGGRVVATVTRRQIVRALLKQTDSHLNETPPFTLLKSK